MANRLVSVDDNFEFPKGVAERQAARLGDSTTAEGAVLAAPVKSPSDGLHLGKSAAGESRTVALTGHSLMYGQDTSATGTLASANGASQTRSATPTTVEFAAAANLMGAPIVVVNQAYPGDKSSDALTRWAKGGSGDMELFWLDTNDAKAYGGGSPLTDAETLGKFHDLTRRAKARGAEVVILGGAPVNSKSDTHKIFSATATDRAIATRIGARFVDIGDLLGDVSDVSAGYWTDGVHLTPAAYSVVGRRLAALLGPKGVQPPTASPGRIFATRDQHFKGGAVVSRPEARGGQASRASSSAGPITFAFEATEGVVPLVTFLVSTGSNSGAVSITTNSPTNRPPVHASFVMQGGAKFVTVAAPPVLSPGPSFIHIEATSGAVEVSSVEFVTASGDGIQSSGSSGRKASSLTAGGYAPRTSANWDGMLDKSAGRALYTDAAQVVPADRKWTYAGILGGRNSGVILADGVRADGGSFLIAAGVMILRDGANLIVRKWIDPTATNTVVNGVFTNPIEHVVLDVNFVAADKSLVIYLNGSLVHTWADFPFKYLTPGLMAGSSTPTSGAIPIAAGVLTTY